MKFYTEFEENKDNAEKLKDLIQKYLNNKEIPYCKECFCFFEKDLAKRVFPDLFNKVDKDGLISFHELNPLDLYFIIRR